MKPALVVVDMQQTYKDWGIFKQLDMTLFMINSALEVFRSKKLPVFFVQHEGESTPVTSPGFELMPGLERKETEFQIIKKVPNAFWQTDFESKLKAEQVDFTLMCGLSAGGCVDATLNGAEERGFSSAILQHGITGPKDSFIEVSHQSNPVISLEVLAHFLK